MALCCGSKDSVNNPSAKYHPDQKQSETVLNMEFRHVPEPQVSELANYVRQRREHVVIPSLATTSDVRAEITRNVTERTQPIDQYPKGRQFLNDEEYLLILKDLLNLSNILDDMEQTGWVPYANRSAYYSECPGGDACGAVGNRHADRPCRSSLGARMGRGTMRVVIGYLPVCLAHGSWIPRMQSEGLPYYCAADPFRC